MYKGKVGQVITYIREDSMMKMANELEVKGYKVKRYYDENFKNYKVKIVGYKGE